LSPNANQDCGCLIIYTFSLLIDLLWVHYHIFGVDTADVTDANSQGNSVNQYYSPALYLVSNIYDCTTFFHRPS